MALTITIEGRGVVSDAETTTDWGVSGSGGISAVQETDLVLQGTYAVSCKSSGNKNAWLYFDESASGTALDFSSGGAEEGEHLYIWMNFTTFAALDTLANDAIRIQLGSGGTTNFSYWTIGGYSSGSQFGNNYTGGWICLVLDPTIPPTGTGGTGLDVSNVSHIGVYIKTLGTAKAENLIIDTIACGKGLRITGSGATDGWQDVADYCNAYASRAWGMLQERQGIYFVYGNLYVGDSTQTAATSLTDSGRVFRFGDFEFYDGSVWRSSLGQAFHGLTVEDASSYATTLQDGEIVGTDAGRNGSLFLGAEDVDTTIELYGGNEATSLTRLYGTSFSRVLGTITWGNDSDHHCYSCAFTRCGLFDPVGAVKIRNCQFVSTRALLTQAVDSALQYDASSTTYTDFTTEANDATTGDVDITPSGNPGSQDAFYVGLKSKFDAIDLDIYQAHTATGGPNTFQYWNGSTWSSVSGLIDETVDLTRTDIHRISWDMPTDWEKITLAVTGTDPGPWFGPFYWFRITYVSAAVGQAIASRIYVHAPASGAALRWNSNIDIEDCSFLANADDYNDPAGIEHPSAGSFDYTGLGFSGNDYDVLNSVDATTTEDSYGEANLTSVSEYRSLTSIGTSRIGQSFTGADGVLSSCRFYARRVSGSGTVVAKLYAHSGTFGTSSVPTGTALVTSANTFDITELDTPSNAFVALDFYFNDPYTLVSGTKYVIVLEWVTGGGNLGVYEDSSSPTHGGNAAYYDGSWHAVSGSDLPFYVFTGGRATISNLAGSGASSAAGVGTPPSGTYIQTAVNLKVTVKDQAGDPIQNAQTAIYTDPGGVELMNEDTTALGVAEQSYNYTTDQDVVVRVRKSSTGATRYVDVEQPQVIRSTGLDITVTMRVDPNIS